MRWSASSDLAEVCCPRTLLSFMVMVWSLQLEVVGSGADSGAWVDLALMLGFATKIF